LPSREKSIGDASLSELVSEVQLLRRAVEGLALSVETLREAQKTLGVAATFQVELAGTRERIIREMDARFEFLVDELSDRLVMLGNEIVALRRDGEGKAARPFRAPVSGGSGPARVPPAARGGASESTTRERTQPSSA
jgi:hypothetical protein